MQKLQTKFHFFFSLLLCMMVDGIFERKYILRHAHYCRSDLAQTSIHTGTHTSSHSHRRSQQCDIACAHESHHWIFVSHSIRITTRDDDIYVISCRPGILRNLRIFCVDSYLTIQYSFLWELKKCRNEMNIFFSKILFNFSYETFNRFVFFAIDTNDCSF